MKSVVIDTGIWVSALVYKGVPGRAVEKAAAQYAIAITKEIYDEIVDVLNRPKFARRVSPLLSVEWLKFILTGSCQWFDLCGNVRDCVDPEDNKFLDCALLVAGADVILSSDRHLRRMDPYRGIRILNPQEFLSL